jgi:hypothetical protein
VLIHKETLQKEWQAYLPTIIQNHLRLLSKKLALEESFDGDVNNLNPIYNVSTRFLMENLSKAQQAVTDLIEK